MDKAAVGGVIRVSNCCFFTGLVDDLRIYRFALSAADVKTVMNGGHPNFRGSMGRYGTSCGTGPLTISFGGELRIGKPIYLQLALGTPKALGFLFFGSKITPIDLTALGFKGCTLYPALPNVMSVGPLTRRGCPIPSFFPFRTATAWWGTSCISRA